MKPAGLISPDNYAVPYFSQAAMTPTKVMETFRYDTGQKNRKKNFY